MGRRRYLIPGSLPTEWMPSKTIETPKPPERKPPARISFNIIYCDMFHTPNYLVDWMRTIKRFSDWLKCGNVFQTDQVLPNEVLRMCYYSLDDVEKEAAAKLPAPWVVLKDWQFFDCGYCWKEDFNNSFNQIWFVHLCLCVWDPCLSLEQKPWMSAFENVPLWLRFSSILPWSHRFAA